MDWLGRKLIGASWVAAAGWKGRALGEGSLSAQILSWEEGWPWGPQARKLKAVGKTRGAGRGRELRGSWKGQTERRTYKTLASLDTILRRPKLSLTGYWVNSRRGAWAWASQDTGVTCWVPPGAGSPQSHTGRLSLTLSQTCRFHLWPPWASRPSLPRCKGPRSRPCGALGSWGIPGPPREPFEKRGQEFPEGAGCCTQGRSLPVPPCLWVT